MEELIEKLKSTVGLDSDTAAKVADFIKDHAADIPKWIGQGKGVAAKIPGVGNLLG